MRWSLRLVLAIVTWGCGCLCSAQCGFSIEPAADVRWFRLEGWATPGVSDAKTFAPVKLEVNRKPQSWNWPEGVSAKIAVHDYGYNVAFPEAVFVDGAVKKRMMSKRFLLYRLIRWEMDGKVFAYSYELGPYDVMCAATIDLIDDTGDGKFRLMIPYGHVLMGDTQSPQIPQWAQRPKL